MREQVLRLIGLGITLSELLICAEENRISHRRVFIIVKELLQEGEIFKIDKKERTGEIFLMPRNIEYPLIDEEFDEEFITY